MEAISAPEKAAEDKAQIKFGEMEDEADIDDAEA